MTSLTPIPPRQKVKSLRFSPLERRYYNWIHRECTCCLTGYTPFDIAHTGPKAMAMKAPLHTCLPLRRELHLIEERTRHTFWDDVGFSDHLDWAARLFDIFESDQDPSDLLLDMQEMADKDFIRSCFK